VPKLQTEGVEKNSSQMGKKFRKNKWGKGGEGIPAVPLNHKNKKLTGGGIQAFKMKEKGTERCVGFQRSGTRKERVRTISISADQKKKKEKTRPGIRGWNNADRGTRTPIKRGGGVLTSRQGEKTRSCTAEKGGNADRKRIHAGEDGEKSLERKKHKNVRARLTGALGGKKKNKNHQTGAG